MESNKFLYRLTGNGLKELRAAILSTDWNTKSPCYITTSAWSIAFMPVNMSNEIIREFNSHWRCFDYSANPVQGFIYRDDDNIYFCYDSALEADKVRFVLTCLLCIYIKDISKIANGVYPVLAIVEGAYRALMPFYDTGIEDLLKVMLYEEPGVAKAYKEGTLSQVSATVCCPTWFLEKWLMQDFPNDFEPMVYRTLCEGYITADMVAEFAEILQKAAHVVQGATFINSKIVVDCVSGAFVKTAEVFDNETVPETKGEEEKAEGFAFMSADAASILAANTRVTQEHINLLFALFDYFEKELPDSIIKEYVGKHTVQELLQVLLDECDLDVEVVYPKSAENDEFDFITYAKGLGVVSARLLYDLYSTVTESDADMYEEAEEHPDLSYVADEEEGDFADEDVPDAATEIPSDCGTLKGSAQAELLGSPCNTATYAMPYSVAGGISVQEQISCVLQQLQSIVQNSDVYKTYKAALYTRREDVLRNIYINGKMDVALQEELGTLCKKIDKLEALESDMLREMLEDMTMEASDNE